MFDRMSLTAALLNFSSGILMRGSIVGIVEALPHLGAQPIQLGRGPRRLRPLPLPPLELVGLCRGQGVGRIHLRRQPVLGDRARQLILRFEIAGALDVFGRAAVIARCKAIFTSMRVGSAPSASR